MTLEEKIRLIIALDELIKRKTKGNSKYYATKLGISRSTFFRLIGNVKREFGVPLIHDRIQERYEYLVDGIIFFGFLPADIISQPNLKKLRKLV